MSVIKQYGERRTGTNAVRAMLRAADPDSLILMYILGDKHAVPVDFDAIWRETQNPFDFVYRATYAARGPCSYEGDLRQRKEIASVAERVTAAFLGGEMRFVVTVKDPFAWIASLARFEQWTHNDAPLAEWDLERVENACRGYNEKYATWLNLDRLQIIRFEDLIEETPIDEVVHPTFWDHLPVRRGSVPFDPTYYREKRYLALLPEEHQQRIADTIDWSVFEPLGYYAATTYV